MDLYRLSGRPEQQQDLLPLNLDYVFENCISLIEWPSRLGDRIPADRLDVRIGIVSEAESEQEQQQQQPFNDADDNTDAAEDRPRRMILEAHGTDWKERLRALRDEGYLDDLLID